MSAAVDVAPASAAPPVVSPSPARKRQGSPDSESCCAHCRARRRRQAAPRRQKDPQELADFAARMIRLIAQDAAAVAEPLEVLPVLAALGRTVDDELHRAVHALRDEYGYTWELIGRGLGITKQSAQERFGGDRR